jgi:hypothetical protein
MSKQETLRHDPNLGEVDPRTYHLVGCVRFLCEKIGSNDRIAQANRLVYAVDKACEASGEHRVRVHLTCAPGIDPKVSVEVRIQPLTTSQKDEEALFAKVALLWPSVLEKGVGRWVAA